MSHHKLEKEPIVSTDWLANHLNDPGLVLIEVDVDTSSYEQTHIPGAVGWNWRTDLQDQTTRDLASPEEFQELARSAGVDPDSHVVLYGDNYNWFATWALWLFQYYGFDRVSILDGGREKWLAENRPTTAEEPNPERGAFETGEIREELRAYREDVEAHIRRSNPALVDVRSQEEFSGEVLAPEGLNETAQRGGHIPGATNITWKNALSADGTFRSPEELAEIYEEEGMAPETETITYCRIGERSSHTWFVLSHLLGHHEVRNYDGSWTEWGNLVGAPIATGSEE